MNRIRHLHGIAVVLAGLAVGLAAGLVAFAAPAFARPVPDPGGGYAPAVPVSAPVRTVTRTLVLGGMPGWQIALIAAGAALLAAAVAVLAYRALATHGSTAPRPA